MGGGEGGGASLLAGSAIRCACSLSICIQRLPRAVLCGSFSVFGAALCGSFSVFDTGVFMFAAWFLFPIGSMAGSAGRPSLVVRLAIVVVFGFTGFASPTCTGVSCDALEALDTVPACGAR